MHCRGSIPSPRDSRAVFYRDSLPLLESAYFTSLSSSSVTASLMLVILKPEPARVQRRREGLRLLAPAPVSEWVRPKNLHIWQVSWSCWSRNCTLRTVAIYCWALRPILSHIKSTCLQDCAAQRHCLFNSVFLYPMGLYGRKDGFFTSQKTLLLCEKTDF